MNRLYWHDQQVGYVCFIPFVWEQRGVIAAVTDQTAMISHLLPMCWATRVRSWGHVMMWARFGSQGSIALNWHLRYSGTRYSGTWMYITYVVICDLESKIWSILPVEHHFKLFCVMLWYLGLLKPPNQNNMTLLLPRNVNVTAILVNLPYCSWVLAVSRTICLVIRLISNRTGGSSYELQWFDIKIGHKNISPINGCQRDVFYWCLVLNPDLFWSKSLYQTLINSSPPSAAYMQQWIRSPLVKIMACRLFGAKPLSEPMLEYCQLDPKEQTSMTISSKYKTFHSRKCIWKYRLRNGDHFVQGEMS